MSSSPKKPLERVGRLKRDICATVDKVLVRRIQTGEGTDANRHVNEAREASLFREGAAAARRSQNSLQLCCICSALLAPRRRLGLLHLC